MLNLGTTSMTGTQGRLTRVLALVSTYIAAVHTGEAELVNSYSAGCQVFKNTTDFKDFMKSLINKSADKLGQLL